MMRPMTLVWLALVGAASGALYTVSYEVEALEGELASLNAEIVAEQEHIRVLRAEWWQLNQPERLRTLAEAYTDLQPLRPDQMADTIDAVPMPLPGQDYRVPAPPELVAANRGIETLPLPQRRPSPVAQGSQGGDPALLVPVSVPVSVEARQ